MGAMPGDIGPGLAGAGGIASDGGAVLALSFSSPAPSPEAFPPAGRPKLRQCYHRTVPVVTEITVTNIGQGATTSGVGFLLGAPDRGLSVNNGCGILLPGADCVMSVQFLPTMPGEVTTTLRVEAAGATPVVLPVQGLGAAPALLNFAQPALNFGPVTVGGPPGTLTLAVTNFGGTATSSAPNVSIQGNVTGVCH